MSPLGRLREEGAAPSSARIKQPSSSFHVEASHTSRTLPPRDPQSHYPLGQDLPLFPARHSGPKARGGSTVPLRPATAPRTATAPKTATAPLDGAKLALVRSPAWTSALQATRSFQPAGPSLVVACTLLLLLLFCWPRLQAQTDCLSCHGDLTMQDAAGHNVGVDANLFHASVHGSLGCSACHADIHGYPHPDHPAPVNCANCHSEQASALVGSVHEHASRQPCTACHGNAHAIVSKDSPKSAVYPLNIPATCGRCHGNASMAKQHHLSNVYPQYVDSIHGFALSKEGLLVAANCSSCHGDHHILSHKDPHSPTYRTNIPKTCGSCHAGILAKYMAGIHGQAMVQGNPQAPVCTACHTAHAISAPTMAESTHVCGNCHQRQLTTYRDTFHSKVSSLGSYIDIARCSDCHGEHGILPASDPRSPVNRANLVKTCGRCHAGANAGFVKYEPHANPRNFRKFPILYSIRLFMVLLITCVMTFFVLHSVLWLIRSLVEKVQSLSAKGGR